MPEKANSTPRVSLPVIRKKDDQAEQPDIGNCHETALCLSRMLLKMGIAMVTAAAVVIPFLYFGNQSTFLGITKPSLLDKSAFQTDKDQSTPLMQIAGTQNQPLTLSDAPGVNPGYAPVVGEPALNEKTEADDKSTPAPPAATDAPPVNPEPARVMDDASLPNERTALDDKSTLVPPASFSATDAPTHKEAASAPASNDTAASRPADESVIQAAQPSDEALFKEYKTWRAAQERTQPVQAARARAVHRARPQGQHNARINQDAPKRNLHNSQKNVRREQTAQMQNASANGAPAPAPSVHARLAKDPTAPNGDRGHSRE